jgi:endonuclease III
MMNTYDQLRAHITKTLFAQILAIRKALAQMPKETLENYLQDTGASRDNNSQVIRLLVLQALNAQCALARREGGAK